MPIRGFKDAAVIMAVLLPSLCMAGEPNLDAAQRDLQRAADHLRAAPDDPRGYRQRALDHVSRALDDVRRSAALLPAPDPREDRQERKRQKREEQLERKSEKREEQLERKREKREEEQWERGQ